MLALGTGRIGRAGTAARDAFVLPRLLRRPARQFRRLTSGEVEPPRFAALISSALLIGSAVIYGASLGGHMPGVVQAVTARTGFAVEDIRITGNRYTSEIDIFQTVGLDGWTSLVGVSADGVRERITELPWVESVEVRKVYPSTLDVVLDERVPFALWQQGGRLLVIEEDGSVIAPLARSQHLELPLLIGAGAQVAAADFLAKVAKHPSIAGRARAYVRVADRRWDLRLNNGIVVKLPEDGYEKALTTVAAADRAQSLLSRAVEVVDMRLDGRLVVKLTADAMEERDAMLKERLGRRYNPGART